MRLYEISNNQELRPQAAAAYVRNILATSIRKRRGPYGVLTLLGGFDVSSAAIKDGHEEEGGEPHLYWLDYYGTMTEVPFAAHGHASYFVLSILDKCVVLPLLSDHLVFPSLILLLFHSILDDISMLTSHLGTMTRTEAWTTVYQSSSDVWMKFRNVILRHLQSTKSRSLTKMVYGKSNCSRQKHEIHGVDLLFRYKLQILCVFARFERL